MYIDAKCIIIIINRIFISIIIEIKRIIIKISIRDIELKIYHSDEYAILIFYMKRILLDNTRAFAQITREIHIVDNLKIEIFIEVDIFISK